MRRAANLGSVTVGWPPYGSAQNRSLFTQLTADPGSPLNLNPGCLFNLVRVFRVLWLSLGASWLAERESAGQRAVSLASVMGPGCCHEEGTTLGHE